MNVDPIYGLSPLEAPVTDGYYIVLAFDGQRDHGATIPWKARAYARAEMLEHDPEWFDVRVLRVSVAQDDGWKSPLPPVAGL